MWFLVRSASAAGAGGGIAPGRLPGSATAGAALDRCSQADHARGPARADLLKKGLALAEEAVAADDGDAGRTSPSSATSGSRRTTPA